MSEEKNNIPVIRISLQVGIGEARALSFETYVDLGAKKEFICAILDTLNYCADRSKAKYDIEALEKQFKQETDLLYAMQDNLVLIDEQVMKRRASNGKRGDNPLTANEEKTRTQVEQQIKERTQRLKDLKVTIATKQEFIKAGDFSGNTPSAANS